MIEPTEGRILIKPAPKETKSKSGIIVPDSAQEKAFEGTIIAIGPGRMLDNGQKVDIEFEVGDVVIYCQYGGTEIKIDNEAYLILSVRDILARKIKEEK